MSFFARHFAPMVRANAALDQGRRDALRSDLLGVYERFNRSTNGHTELEGEFLSVEVVPDSSLLIASQSASCPVRRQFAGQNDGDMSKVYQPILRAPKGSFFLFGPRVAALCHAEIVNVSGIARDAGAARTTVASYLEILEDTLLAFRLPAFEARLRVRERRHPKLYGPIPVCHER